MSTILERVLQVSATQLNVDLSSVKPDSAYTTDLGADSLDLIELEMAIEQEFGVEFPETNGYAFKTPDDFVAWIQHREAQQRAHARLASPAKSEREVQIEGRMQELRALEHRHIDAKSRTIQAALMQLEASPPTEQIYGERLVEAGMLHNTALLALRVQLSKAQAREAAAEARDVTEAAVAMVRPAGPTTGNQYDRSAAAVSQVRRRDDKGPPTLKLGEIQSRLGMRVTEVFLTGLGYPPALAEQGARYYHQADFAPICSAIASHVLTTATRNWLAATQQAAKQAEGVTS